MKLNSFHSGRNLVRYVAEPASFLVLVGGRWGFSLPQSSLKSSASAIRSASSVRPEVEGIEDIIERTQDSQNEKPLNYTV